MIVNERTILNFLYRSKISYEYTTKPVNDVKYYDIRIISRIDNLPTLKRLINYGFIYDEEIGLIKFNAPEEAE